MADPHTPSAPGDAIAEDPDRKNPFGDHGPDGIGPTEGMDVDPDEEEGEAGEGI